MRKLLFVALALLLCAIGVVAQEPKWPSTASSLRQTVPTQTPTLGPPSTNTPPPTSAPTSTPTSTPTPTPTLTVSPTPLPAAVPVREGREGTRGIKMITLSFTIPLLDIAIACAVVGAILLSEGVIYALVVLTGPHWDGKGFAPVIQCLLWR